MKVSSLPKHRLTVDIDGDLDLRQCELTSLEGCPTALSGGLFISRNKLSTLLGGPTIVGNHFGASQCALTDLNGIPARIGGDLYLENNPLTSLQGINKLKEMNGWIYLRDCPITSHILGVFFIKGCKGIFAGYSIQLQAASDIVNKHISKGRSGLIYCTQELIRAGLSQYADI
jgi:hypothetical protein